MKNLYLALGLTFMYCHGVWAIAPLEVSCPLVTEHLQKWCAWSYPSVANLKGTDQGDGLVWFSSQTATIPLDPSTALVDGATYYAGTTSASCQGSRQEVLVELEAPPRAGSHMNLTFQSDDPPVDLFTLLEPNQWGDPDPGGTLEPSLKSGSMVFDPSLDGNYSGASRRFQYWVYSNSEVCGNTYARIYITINPQPNSSHRLVYYGETKEEAYYKEQNYTPAPGEGTLYNIWGDAPLEVGSIYKITLNGLDRYYYVNNVYAEPELNPQYTLTADTPIQKFTYNSEDEIFRTVYTGPSLNDGNYVYSRSPQVPLTDTDSIAYTDQVIEQITYFDGLGRGRQTIGIRAGGNGEDIITHIEYDEFGRQSKDFLPYARNTLGGEMHPEIIEAERIYGPTLPYTNFYDTSKYGFTKNPYSEKEFEASPLNRVLKQAAPGTDWKLGNGHEVEFDYHANSDGEVRLFSVALTTDYTPSLEVPGSGFYAAGDLYKTVTRDENHSGTTKNHTSEEFKDKQGRVVLKRTYADTPTQTQVPHDTYYVYDDYGNLTYILPPKLEGSTAFLQDILNKLDALGYRYRYDYRNRLVEKIIPGKKMEYIYNSLDQPVLAQDAVQRAKREWLYTKYDAFGRVTSTGIYTHSTVVDQKAMQALLDTHYSGNTPPKPYEEKSGSIYTNRSFPTLNTETLTETYYDDYNFDKASITVPAYNQYGKPITTTRTKGLQTGARVKVLQQGTPLWITTVSGYDKKGRPVWSTSQNDYLQTSDVVHSNLDFVGKLIAQTNRHIKTGSPTVAIEDLYTYDAMGRQLTHTQNINGGAGELIAKNTYDELGVLIKKNVGGQVNDIAPAPAQVTTAFDELVHLEVRENGEIYKISGGTSEAGIAKTIQTIKGDGYVEFSPMLSDKIFSVGLTYVDPSNPNYEYNYLANVVRNYIKVNEGGANLEHSMDYQVNVQPGDRLTVERQGHTILYKHNGETYHVSTTPSYGELRGKATVRNPGAIMHYIKIVDLEENQKALQTLNYTYNVRGWLKSINEPINLGNDLFGFEINYNDPQAGATPLFNGNISETHWNSQSQNITNNPVSNQYLYSYDALNRITEATDNTGNYNLSGISYDKMGNILSLQRQGQLDADITGFGAMDDLNYTYNNGNQLQQVDDFSNNLEGFNDGNPGIDYTYDTNGNLTSDANKGITNITYNHLNLPVDVEFNGSSSQTIHYTYDATGVKLKKEIPGKETEYAGNFVYEKFGTGANELQFFNHPEGYVSYDGGQFNYVYNYVDHLGNVRLSYSDTNGDGQIRPEDNEILDEKNYYPFGLEHQGYNTNVVQENNYKTYQGKEIEKELGKNTIAFGWRDYDPAIARFNKIDRFAEKYKSMSPYHFSGNNPIFFREIKGDSIDPGSQAKVDALKVNINTQVTSLTTQRDAITTAATNKKGKVKYSKAQQAQVKELNYRLGNLNTSLTNIASLESSTKFTFKLNAVSGSIANLTPSVADVNSNTFTLNYISGDVGNQIHEVATHGSQIVNGDIAYSVNAAGTGVNATVGAGVTSYGLEVSAYQSQYSYGGILSGFQTPAAGSTQATMNTIGGFTGTANQINSPFTITNHSHINVPLIKSMTEGSIGHTTMY